MRRALITGITGQDGSYLAELLLGKGYEVHGLIRRASLFNTGRIDHLYRDPHETDARLYLHYGDLTDGARLVTLMREIDPDEVYNLGAQSHVRVSLRRAGAHRQQHRRSAPCGCSRPCGCPASSAASTRRRARRCSARHRRRRTSRPPFHPRSPYGVAKVYAYWATKNYREAYGLFAVNGILFNHESPRRGETFVTRKITRAVARIKAGLDDHVYMGNLDAERDWGYAPEYVEGMWRMLQADEPDDFVLATGSSHHGARLHGGGVQPRRARLGEARPLRRPLPAALRGRRALRRRRQGRAGARLEADRRRRRSSRRSWSTPTSRRSQHEGRPWIDQPGPGRLAGDADDRLPSPARSTATRRRTSPGTAAWSAPRSGAGWRRRASPTCVGRASSELDLRDRDAVVRLPRRDPAALRRAGGRQGRRHPGQRHLPGGVPLRQPADPDQRHGRGARAAASSGCSSWARPASTRRLAPQPIREDSLLTGPLEPTNDAYAIAKIAGILRRPGGPPRVRPALDLGDADQPLRPGRQLLADRLATCCPR